MDNPQLLANLVARLLVVLGAGLAAGAVCKRLGVSMVVGFLLAGALLGSGGVGFVSRESHELSYLAEAGALLLLFSIGIEFPLEELVRMSRHFLVGGVVQMLLAGVPIGLAAAVFGFPWPAATLLGAAAALSSTVLVYRALQEWGQASAPHGRRAVGILLFQDVALVPLMLIIPLLAGGQPQASVREWGFLAIYSLATVALVPLARAAIVRWAVPLLASLRSTELLVLFTLTLLGAAGLGAFALGFPPAMGAFAAGLVLGGNRLSAQIDALILPYRETFAAVFFVSLGTLMRFDAVLAAPLVAIVSLMAVLAVKAGAGAVALRAVGLHWRAAAGMGLGLAQLGEFSFLVLSEGLRQDVLSPAAYDLMLFIALGTLVLTPQLLKTGLRWAGRQPEEESASGGRPDLPIDPAHNAVVIGLGPIGGQVASQLEISGLDVCLVDLSPVNLHRFAQQGFRTVAGDGADPEVLHRAGIERSRLAVVTVPDDRAAMQVVSLIRRLNPSSTIVVRCRYQATVPRVRRAGANAVISEEAEASEAILRLLGQMQKPGNSEVASAGLTGCS